MLLVPLSGRAAADLPALVLRGETRLIAHGPTATSLIVIADDDQPTWPTFLFDGILPLAAGGRLCGNDLSFRGDPA